MTGRRIDELRAGVVGTGFIGAVHVDALRRLGVEVTGVVGSTPERAEAKRLAPVYESYEALLADERVDVVHLTTPNNLHYPQVKAALEAGKHVVCEKPLALTAAESRRAARARRAQRARALHELQHPLLPDGAGGARRARATSARSGTCTARYLQDWLLYPTDWNWRLEPGRGRRAARGRRHRLALARPRSVRDGTRGRKRCSPTWRLRFRCGSGRSARWRRSPRRPTSSGSTSRWRPRTSPTSSSASAAARAARASSRRCPPAARTRSGFEVDGSRGSLAWDGERPSSCGSADRDAPNELLLRNPGLMDASARATTHLPAGHAEGFADTFRELYRAVYRAVAAGEPGGDYPTFRAGHVENVLGEAIAQSNRERTMGGGDPVKLGLLTAAFPRPLARGGRGLGGRERLRDARGGVLARRAAASSGGTRASRTSTSTRSTSTRCTRRSTRHGVAISSLAYYPNNLHPDDAQREEVNAHLRKVIDAAQALGVGIVGTFVGNDKDRPLPENLDRFRRIWPELVAYAGERDVKIAIENCPMIFSYDEWPGGNNLAWSPAIWDEMFAAIPDANFGLNLDPSHLVWLMIDYERAVYDFGDRIFHAHAKDLEIRRDGLYRHGTLLGRHRLAGAAPPRARRGRLAAVRRRAVRRRLRPRPLGRARGPALRGRRRSSSSAAS